MVINQNVTAPIPNPLAAANAAGSNIDSPSFSQRNVSTQVTVEDGDTVAIGGIITEDYTESISGIPFLDRLPYIGFVFGQKQTTRRSDGTDCFPDSARHLRHDANDGRDRRAETESQGPAKDDQGRSVVLAKTEDESRPLARLGMDGHGATLPAHEVADDGQPQARPVRAFGGEEGLENLLARVGGNARAGIAHFDGARRCGDAKGAVETHRIAGVRDQVGQGARQGERVGADRGQQIGNVELEIDAFGEPKLGDEVPQEDGRVGGTHFNGIAVAICEQACGEGRAALGGPLRGCDIAQGQVIHDKIELIINIVRDSGGGGSDQFQAVAVHAWIVSPLPGLWARVSPQVVHS